MTEMQTSVSTEIGRAVGSIWQRRTGARPTSVDTKFDGDRISCVIAAGKPTAEETAELAGRDPVAGIDSNAYRHEASSAVARITKRTVSAYIAKGDKQSAQATQIFILERARIKN